MINKKQDLSPIKDAAVESTLKTLRNQRDLNQQQEQAGTYEVNPQIFSGGTHYVTEAIAFKTPFQITPAITFGQLAQRATENVTGDIKAITSGTSGYVPLIIHPYVFGFDQDAGGIKGFYLGLYSMTPVPKSAARYIISWNAKGKGTSYPQQRIDEAWTSSYNKNEADYLLDDTGEVDPQ